MENKLKPLDLEFYKKVSENKCLYVKTPYIKRVLAVLERDGFKCVKCPSTTNLTIDHIKPKRGIAYIITLENSQTLCVECHQKKNLEDNK